MSLMLLRGDPVEVLEQRESGLVQIRRNNDDTTDAWVDIRDLKPVGVKQPRIEVCLQVDAEMRKYLGTYGCFLEAQMKRASFPRFQEEVDIIVPGYHVTEETPGIYFASNRWGISWNVRFKRPIDGTLLPYQGHMTVQAGSWVQISNKTFVSDLLRDRFVFGMNLPDSSR